MKVLVLGGAGDMGRMAVAILLESPSVSSVTVGDIDIDLANRFVELVGSPKLSATQVDIKDKQKLVDVITLYDVIVNTVGPFYTFEVPILEAVLEAKKPLLDICDDWKPTLDALEFDQRFKDAGLTAIIGIGASPGITNIMAAYACSKLDKVDELVTAWGMGNEDKVGREPKYYITPRKIYKKLNRDSRKPNAAIQHLLYETLEPIPILKDGKMIDIEPLKETVEKFQFPGFKEIYSVHIGHPEPVTLPRTLKAKNVSNVMYLGETVTNITRKYSNKINNKELTISEAAIALDKELRDLTKRAYTDKKLQKEFTGQPPGLSVIATGSKDGKKKKVAVALDYVPYGEMAGVTSIPLAITTLMFIEGQITKKGVLTPEEVFKDNPLEFFDRIAPYCGKNLSGKDVLLEKIIEL